MKRAGRLIVFFAIGLLSSSVYAKKRPVVAAPVPPEVVVSSEASVEPSLASTDLSISTQTVQAPAESPQVSSAPVVPAAKPAEVKTSTPTPEGLVSGGMLPASTSYFDHSPSTAPANAVEKISIDDTGTRLLVMIHLSKPTDCFIFERRDPPSLFVQFITTPVFASGHPVEAVGLDPLSEIRYGYSTFNDASAAADNREKKYQIDFLELRLNRSVFYHIQQEGWVVVIGLDRTTTKIEVPELDFRFDVAKYEGAANIPKNPRINDFVQTAQANSRLMAVSRDEAELAKKRIVEAQRALLPSVTGRVAATRGKEKNPFPNENFEGFEGASFRRDEYGVSVAQPIWQSGRLYGAYKQAKLNRQMALENVRKQAQDLTYEVKKAYYTLIKNQTTLRIRRELVAQGEAIKSMTKKKLDLHLTSKSELLNVSAQADQASYQMTSDEQDVSLSRLVLISLLNQSDSVPDPVSGALSFAKLSFNVESIIAWAQEHRPDVRIARLNSELARYNWKAARADNGLKLDFSGFYGRAGATFDEADSELRMEKAWNAGFKLSRSFWGNSVRANYSKESTAPDLGQVFITNTQQKSVEVGLLDGLPGLSNAKQAQLQYEKAQAELVEAGRKAEYEVRESYYNLEKAARQIAAVREDMLFRQKDLDISREKVKLGLAEFSQLMSAEISSTQAQVTEQDALAAYNIALSNIDRVVGAEVVKE